MSSTSAGVMEMALPKAEQPLGSTPQDGEVATWSQSWSQETVLGGWRTARLGYIRVGRPKGSSGGHSPMTFRKSFASGTHGSLTHVFIGRCPEIGRDLLRCCFMSAYQWGHCACRAIQATREIASSLAFGMLLSHPSSWAPQQRILCPLLTQEGTEEVLGGCSLLTRFGTGS